LGDANRCCARGAGPIMLDGMTDIVPSPFLPVIQLAVTPVILISGMGALMITLTNRMGRIVDRTRVLAGQVRGSSGEDRADFESQLKILWRRVKLIRLAVTFVGLSMLLSCLLVLVILADASLRREFGAEMVSVFVASILCLIFGLSVFLRDIFMSLHALQIEVDRASSRS
jgi:hypothetical protein